MKVIVIEIFQKALWTQYQATSKSFPQLKVLINLFLMCVCLNTFTNFPLLPLSCFESFHLLMRNKWANMCDVCVLVTQSCLTLCNPMNCSPPAFFVHGILQARIPEPGFSVYGILQARILEWIAIPFSEDLPNPGIQPWSPVSQADSLPLEQQGSSVHVILLINLLLELSLTLLFL